MTEDSEEYATKAIQQFKDQFRGVMKDFDYRQFAYDNLPVKLKGVALVNGLLTGEEIDHVGHGLQSMVDYILDEVPCGEFIEAVYEEDLVRTFALADHINEVAMKVYAAFLSNQVPVALRN